jgi:hypothetical protein
MDGKLMRIEAGKMVHGLLQSVHIEPWMNYPIYREGVLPASVDVGRSDGCPS